MNEERDCPVGNGKRLAVARALLRTAPVVVLDEPVAQLDTISEQYFNGPSTLPAPDAPSS